MKKAIIVLLIAVVAMTAVFANTSDKEGFVIKAGVGYLGEYGATYRLGDFEFGLSYLTYGLPLGIILIIESGNPLNMVAPFGILASAQYKFLATEQHEVGAFLKAGWSAVFGSPIAIIGAEYDFCFNQNNAIYAQIETFAWPFMSLEGLLYSTMIGYRYSF